MINHIFSFISLSVFVFLSSSLHLLRSLHLGLVHSCCLSIFSCFTLILRFSLRFSPFSWIPYCTSSILTDDFLLLCELTSICSCKPKFTHTRPKTTQMKVLCMSDVTIEMTCIRKVFYLIEFCCLVNCLHEWNKKRFAVHFIYGDCEHCFRNRPYLQQKQRNYNNNNTNTTSKKRQSTQHVFLIHQKLHAQHQNGFNEESSTHWIWWIFHCARMGKIHSA